MNLRKQKTGKPDFCEGRFFPTGFCETYLEIIKNIPLPEN